MIVGEWDTDLPDYNFIDLKFDENTAECRFWHSFSGCDGTDLLTKDNILEKKKSTASRSKYSGERINGKESSKSLIKERLRQVKDFLDQGLTSKEEAEKKRKEILETL